MLSGDFGGTNADGPAVPEESSVGDFRRKDFKFLSHVFFGGVLLGVEGGVSIRGLGAKSFAASSSIALG